MIRSLTFQDNNAEIAMDFYVELFDNSKIINVHRWGNTLNVIMKLNLKDSFQNYQKMVR